MNGQAARTSARASSDTRPQSHRPRVHMAAFAAGKSCPATGITGSRRAQTLSTVFASRGYGAMSRTVAKRLDWQISRSRRTVSNSVMLTAVNVCYCHVPKLSPALFHRSQVFVTSILVQSTDPIHRTDCVPCTYATKRDRLRLAEHRPSRAPPSAWLLHPISVYING